MKIAIAGTGYVGLSNSVLLAQHHNVVALDIVPERVERINRREAPFADPELKTFLAEKQLSLHATLSREEAYESADFIVIAVPTDYDPVTHSFNSAAIESVIRDAMAINSNAVMVIRSTIPVGYVQHTRQALACDRLLFCPEFLREGRALHDNLFPARIVVGERSERARLFAELLLQGAMRKDVPVLLTEPGEAEAIKLFANAYLAMRVAFFNELDTFAMANGLDTRRIIEAVSLDPRIGSHYNNPSFGYGGYCLPKDIRQLLTSYREVPHALIRSVIASNSARKDFIAQDILARRPKRVGIHRLIMKSGTDNFRASSILGIMNRIMEAGVEVTVHEPALNAERFCDARVERDLAAFKRDADLIVSNRMSAALRDVAHKVYTRDLYGSD